MGFFSRIGVAIDSGLLTRLDNFTAKQGYTNRPEAFPDLIRDRLVISDITNPRAPVVAFSKSA